MDVGSFTCVGSFTLRVVDYAEIRGKCQAAKIFKVDRIRVHEWCGQKENSIVLRTTKYARSKRLTSGGRKVTSEDIEKTVLDWMNERCSCYGKVPAAICHEL